MLFSDHDIKNAMASGSISITPFDEHRLQPSSYDVTLEARLLRQVIPSRHGYGSFDLRNSTSPDHELIIMDDEDGYVLHPGQFILGSTVEKFIFSDRIAGRMEGKSSLGRMGLSIHTTAGFFDPGFHGTGTLEITNHGHSPIRLYPGVAIAQMCFFWMMSPPERRYGVTGAYSGQEGPTPPRYRP